MVERREASIDKNGVLGAGSGAKGIEERGDQVIGDIMLLDAGLDNIDLVDLGIGGCIGSRQCLQVCEPFSVTLSAMSSRKRMGRASVKTKTAFWCE